MVTYSELFAYTLVIIGIVGLMLQIANRQKMTAPAKVSVIF